MTIRRLIAVSILAILPRIVLATEYTYPELVRRLTDLQELAKLPPPGEKTSLASSYDRRSQYDAANDKYIAWDANGDGSGVVRREGQQIVMADIQGPGCIWRTWSAQASTGHVKIYLDGSPAPAVDLPFKSYFDGTTAPFNRPNLVYTTGKLKAPIGDTMRSGLDNYTPISFARSCKIVADPNWGSYYQFTYTQFPPGTIVPTFGMNLSPADAAALDQADHILGQCGRNPVDPLPGAMWDRMKIDAQPGKQTTVDDLTGAGAVTALKVKLDLPVDPEAQRILLRQLTISIRWDDEATPAVWSPLGDFFAYVGGADSFESLPLGLAQDGAFYSYWYMPYGAKAHIEAGNDGPAAVSMTWEIEHAPLTQPITGLARFHAKWHRDAFLPDRKDRFPDWTLLVTQGRGRYVGTHLHGWNPRGSWWGEGDDKFFVDGEKFPSTYGTGSEDYFGYAWGAGEHFSRAFQNQILSEHEGHFDDNRWHVADSMPFQKSFEGDIEKYFANDRPTLYAAEVYWYLNAGGSDPYTAIPMKDRAGYWVRPQIYREPEVIEGESLRLPSKPEHAFGRKDMFTVGKSWSGDAELEWKPENPGETVSLELPAQKAGTYAVEAHYTKGPDFGIFQASMSGADLGRPVDLYAPTVSVSDVIDLGKVTLADGKPVLTITLTGKNAASKGTVYGLDYLKLVPVHPPPP
jgi:hypothetical protein